MTRILSTLVRAVARQSAGETVGVEHTMQNLVRRLAVIIGAASLALYVISGPSQAQAVVPAAEDGTANEQVIITNLSKHKSRVREFLKRLLGKASAARAKLRSRARKFGGSQNESLSGSRSG
jgi:hypothetical protein